MATKAIIEDNIVTTVCIGDITKSYHPDLQALFVDVPDDTNQGDVRNPSDNTFKHAGNPKTISPDIAPFSTQEQEVPQAVFKSTLTRAERKAWKAKIGSDDTVDAMQGLWDETPLASIWLANVAENAEYKDALTNLKAAGVIGDATIAKLTTLFKLDRDPKGESNGEANPYES